MKKARPMCLLVVPCVALILSTTLRADTTAMDTSSFTHVDADGVPVSLNPEHMVTPSEAVSKMEEQNTKPAQGQDWLITGYEQQMINRGGGDNRYLQISSNKQLAELAGVPYIGDSVQRSAPSAENSPSGNTSTSDAAATSSQSAFNSGYQWRPVISPIGSSIFTGAQNYAAPLPGNSPISTGSLFIGQNQAVAKPIVPNVPDAESIETPGAVAAQQNSDLGLNGSDLTIDLLPGESPSHLEPPPVDADQLHQQEAEQTSPAKPQTVATTTAPTTDQAKKQQVKPVLLPEDDNSPTPISQIQPVSPVRAPISSPYSILNR